MITVLAVLFRPKSPSSAAPAQETLKYGNCAYSIGRLSSPGGAWSAAAPLVHTIDFRAAAKT
jgi:hypothetical protein